MNPEIGSDPFLRPQVGRLNLARQAAAEAVGLRRSQSAAVSGPTARGPETHAAAPDSAGRVFHQRSDEVGGYVGKAGPREATGDFSFEDLIDLVNPLQHIPGVATLYREITGDQISAPAEVLGGMLYGGPVGFVSAMANTLVREASGQDIGQNVLAAIFNDGPDGNAAAAAPPETAAGPVVSAHGNERTTDNPVPAYSDPPSAVQQPVANLTGKAALEALAADFGVGAVMSQPAAATLVDDDETPAAIEQSSNAVRRRVPTMALRDRDWRAGGPEARPRTTALDAPWRLASAVTVPEPDLQALDRGNLVPGLPAAKSPLPFDMLSRGSGSSPSAVAPQLLATGQEDKAFAGRMLEALEKYESMKRQGQP